VLLRIIISGEYSELLEARESIIEQQPEFRTWIDAAGAISIKARLLAVESVEVTLEREDGSQIVVPIELLSTQDQEWIEDRPSRFPIAATA